MAANVVARIFRMLASTSSARFKRSSAFTCHRCTTPDSVPWLILRNAARPLPRLDDLETRAEPYTWRRWQCIDG